MQHSAGYWAILVPVISALVPVAIVAIVFWYKARARELELQESLKRREIEHLQRLKELELEIERTKAQNKENSVVS